MANLNQQGVEYLVSKIHGAIQDSKNNVNVTTYSELKTLRDTNELIPGCEYRITDYETITIQSGTQSAGHNFDIIVTALTENTVSENASACYHDEVDNVSFISGFRHIGGWDSGGGYFEMVEGDLTEINGKEYIGYVDNSFGPENILYFDFNDSSKVKHDKTGDITFYPSYYIAPRFGITEITDASIMHLADEIYIANIVLSQQTNNTIRNEIKETFNINYFKNIGANLSAWKLKYKLENDDANYCWVDSVNGKGVIYEMTDEFNNTLPYDFKNIMFKRFAVINSYNYLIGKYAGWEGTFIDGIECSENDFKYFYTFSCHDKESDNVYDSSLNIYSNRNNKLIVTNNHYLPAKLTLFIAKGKQYILNDFVHICDINLQDGAYCSGINNTKIGIDCYNYTILDGCSNWEIKDNSNYVIICPSCNDWEISYNSKNIVVGLNNSGWKIGNDCNNISTINGCNDWEIGNGSFNISLSHQSSNWKIGNGCHDFDIQSIINNFEILNGFNGLVDSQRTIISLPETDFTGQQITYPLFVSKNEYNVLTIWNPASPINYQYVERNTYWGGDFTTGTPHDILPNTYNEWTAKAPKSIRLVNSEENKTAEYVLKFTVSDAGHSIVFENEITWRNNDIPMWETGKTYEISIVNGLASYMEF